MPTLVFYNHSSCILHYVWSVSSQRLIYFFVVLNLFAFSHSFTTFSHVCLFSLHSTRAAWAAVFESHPCLAGLILHFFVDTLYFPPSFATHSLFLLFWRPSFHFMAIFSIFILDRAFRTHIAMNIMTDSRRLSALGRTYI